jgi:putative transposase
LDLPLVEKIKLIEPDNVALSIRRQCDLLDIYRSNYYYERKPVVSAADELLMKKIDEIHTKCPMYGVRKMTKQLHRAGEKANHKRVQRLMQVLGIQAIYPGPNTSKPGNGHSIYPYLLTGMEILQPNQVWGVDITYIRMHKEWVYLVAFIDWYSRYVLSWELSDTMSVGFCMEALTNALKLGIPEIHNSDQGSQFTAQEYLMLLQAYPEIRISMDHRGRCFDNIFTERLWRTIKYEEVYVKDYQSPREARENIASYINFYNNERLHQSLNYQTPKEIHFGN